MYCLVEQQVVQVSYLDAVKDMFAEEEQNYSCTADQVHAGQFIASTTVATKAQLSTIIDCIADSDQAITAATDKEVYLSEVQSYLSSYFDYCESVVGYCQNQQASRTVTTSFNSLKEVCSPMHSSMGDQEEVGWGQLLGRMDSMHFLRLLGERSIKLIAEVSTSFN